METVLLHKTYGSGIHAKPIEKTKIEAITWLTKHKYHLTDIIVNGKANKVFYMYEKENCYTTYTIETTGGLNND